jgi:RNA polymerase sigma factor (TIGR02999 family)
MICLLNKDGSGWEVMPENPRVLCPAGRGKAMAYQRRGLVGRLRALHEEISTMADAHRPPSGPGEGDSQAAERLLPLVYDELRRLACWRLRRESPGQTLQATALVHEAYVRLVVGHPDRRWDGTRHFFAAAAEAMRRILVDRARARHRLKRGGGRGRVDLDLGTVALDAPDRDLIDLDPALTDLAREDALCARWLSCAFSLGSRKRRRRRRLVLRAELPTAIGPARGPGSMSGFDTTGPRWPKPEKNPADLAQLGFRRSIRGLAPY